MVLAWCVDNYRTAGVRVVLSAATLRRLTRATRDWYADHDMRVLGGHAGVETSARLRIREVWDIRDGG